MPYRACVECGVPLFRSRQTVCEACERKAKAAYDLERMRSRLGYTPRTECIDCGAPIPNPGHGRERCPACRKERERLLDRNRMRERRRAAKQKVA